MKTVRGVLLFVAIACALCTSYLFGQDVHVSSEKGVTTLGVTAQKAYALGGSAQSRSPVLSVSCQQKGKKSVHAIMFSPGGILTEQEYSTFGGSATLTLQMTAGAHKQPTIWVTHGDLQTFSYYGKTEQERIQFLQMLLSSPTVSLEFTPFLTGLPASSTFDLTGLRTEFDKHPECSMKPL